MTIHLPAETALALAMALTDARYDLHAKRTAAERAIEDLINFLDDTEGDCDLEESFGFDALEGGDVLDEPHDEIAEDGRDVSWPEEQGPHSLGLNFSDEDCEDTHDAEATNEDGGNVTDEPHDALDEGNDEYSLDGVQADCPTGWGMSWDEVQACKGEARNLLARVPHRSHFRPEQWITGPDGSQYRFVS